MIILTNDLLTHVPEIDQQHQKFITCLNDLVDAITAFETAAAEHAEKKVMLHAAFEAKEQVKHALHVLGAYIVKHFQDEEALQEKYAYPNMEWHKELHRWYVAEFHKLQEEYLENGITVAFMELLKTSMLNWITKHILTADISLGQHINKQIRQAGRH